MAKKIKSKKTKKVKEVQEVKKDVEMEVEEDPETDVGNTLTLAQIDAISDEENEEEAEWNAEAQALRQAISEGAFNKLKLNNSGDSVGNDDNDNKANDVQLEDDSSSEEKEEDGEEEIYAEEKRKKANSLKALRSVTTKLTADKACLPWPEKLDVVPPTPLPFGQVTEDGLVIDVHDDLKREVAFYNLALEAVHSSRTECERKNVPYSRPADFFAEMVKTDDHMAMVKDRLIFEGKKMDAFEQRKSNREQKLRAKEKHAHRLSEKAKSKRKHMDDVEDWAKSAASNRVGGGKIQENDDEYLGRMNGKKRQGMDKKYGFGGKKGRFKQNDARSMNDMSSYNPKGNFSGGKKSAGSKRKGKRSRDATKAKR
mmetsp:Transcript_22022/g.32159  ORF Transcript_22022/g.32159 Transcript_22022/m.32159 type:complete len:369 (+) Transcript_22022:56-1162(+)|eukprot:CAMPEP_0197248944 /NCGR_PEP_ID=MMETSP1429-20130617/44038_1 /TAXON_ID=49237 /ORGANISM="Chaetoceros  sp., Strain UNC1202" /LENGTH=368 /DNA_ID=CAMNT_0042710325 /DNA_START=46 /DNA_END=1152 /DNA_ORIENTATION=-